MKISLRASLSALCLTLAVIGCEGNSSSPAATPVGGVDVDPGEPVEPNGERVRVNVGGGRVDVDAGGVNVDVGEGGVKVDAEGREAAAERRERRREKIGEALENLKVDVEAGGVDVDVN
ncbi:hypothetical protein [Roseimaritima ulvae]|uniref:Uncharacterized protein n=1 Tax=Roseimaritima ulvae TaxID=980254 RepID=A0A5B9QNS6_9BACT|nr:hypothetical protein [Roseimaritima ulvae]QEG40757.1 hypothetical protein UC8_27740 [Roseimaritima ulvae]